MPELGKNTGKIQFFRCFNRCKARSATPEVAMFSIRVFILSVRFKLPGYQPDDDVES